MHLKIIHPLGRVGYIWNIYNGPLSLFVKSRRSRQASINKHFKVSGLCCIQKCPRPNSDLDSACSVLAWGELGLWILYFAEVSSWLNWRKSFLNYYFRFQREGGWTTKPPGVTCKVTYFIVLLIIIPEKVDSRQQDVVLWCNMSFLSSFSEPKPPLYKRFKIWMKQLSLISNSVWVQGVFRKKQPSLFPNPFQLTL